MKTLYKKVFWVLGAIVILGYPLLTNAKENVDMNRELKTMAIEKYDTENNVIGQMPYAVNRLIVTKDEIIIQYSGESEFVDAIGIDTDGKTYFLSEYAVWESSDSNVVYADRGRILAENVGNAIVTVSYGEYKQQIQVSVKEHVNYETILAGTFDLQNMTNEQRLRYVQNANSMVNYKWTPTQNLTGWKGNYVFKAGTTYSGIPYTQSPNQTNLAAFQGALTKSDFYSTYTNSSGKMPRYGNDCSGFLSFAYEIPRQTTAQFVNGIKSGTYKKIGSYDPNNLKQNDLLSSYSKLTAGDAVVKSGHAMFVANNVSSENYCLMYEQTPGHAQTTKWTYSSLVAGGYMPFSK